MEFMKGIPTPKGHLRNAKEIASELLAILDELDLTETEDNDAILLDRDTEDKIRKHGESLQTATRCSIF